MTTTEKLNRKMKKAIQDAMDQAQEYEKQSVTSLHGELYKNHLAASIDIENSMGYLKPLLKIRKEIGQHWLLNNNQKETDKLEEMIISINRFLIRLLAIYPG